MPGVRLEIVLNGSKQDLRFKGEHIYPGYRNKPAATKATAAAVKPAIRATTSKRCKASSWTAA